MQLDPNRYARSKEGLLVRAQIADEQAEHERRTRQIGHARSILHDAECALLEAQACAELARESLEKLLREERSSAEHLQRLQGLVHPVRLVPEELLAEIFMLAVHIDSEELYRNEFKQQPFDVAAVCRRWRRVATSTPRLWTRVILLDLAAEEVGTYLKNMLTRSEGLDLKVFIYCDPLDFRHHSHTINARMLSRTSHLFLSVRSTSRSLVMHPGGTPQWSLFECAVPRLQYLKVDGNKDFAPGHHLIARVAGLKTIKLEDTVVDFSPYTSFHDLESITLKNSLCSLTALDILSRSAMQLRYFDIRLSDVTGRPPSIPIAFPTVTEVIVSTCNVAFWRNVRFPKAEVASLLFDQDDDVEISFVAEIFPDGTPLRKLTVEGEDPVQDFDLSLRCGAALESLTLDSWQAVGWVPFFRRLAAAPAHGTRFAPRLKELRLVSHRAETVENATAHIHEALVSVAAGRASSGSAVDTPDIKWHAGEYDAAVQQHVAIIHDFVTR